jgi:plasmid stabilization system protein ParE
MAYQVEISPLALADVDEAYLWLYQQSAIAAARWFRGLRKAIDSLELKPTRRASPALLPVRPASSRRAS